MEIKNLFKCTYRKLKLLFKICICKNDLTCAPDRTRDATLGKNYTKRNERYSVENPSSCRIPAVEQIEPLLNLTSRYPDYKNYQDVSFNNGYVNRLHQLKGGGAAAQAIKESSKSTATDDLKKKQMQMDRLKKEMGTSELKLLNLVVNANKASSTATMNKNLKASSTGKNNWMTTTHQTHRNHPEKSLWPVSFLFAKSKQSTSKSLNIINNTNYNNKAQTSRRSKSKSSSSLLPVTWPCSSDYNVMHKPYSTVYNASNNVFYHNNFLEAEKSSKKFTFTSTINSGPPARFNYFNSANRSESSYSINLHKLSKSSNASRVPNHLGLLAKANSREKNQIKTRFKLQPFLIKFKMTRPSANRNSLTKAKSSRTSTTYVEKMTLHDLPRWPRNAPMGDQSVRLHDKLHGGLHSISSASSTPTSINCSKKHKKVLFEFHKREESAKLLNDYLKSQNSSNKSIQLHATLKLDELVTGKQVGHSPEQAEDKLLPSSSSSHSASLSNSFTKSRKPLAVLETSFEENVTVAAKSENANRNDSADPNAANSSPVSRDAKAHKLENHSV